MIEVMKSICVYCGSSLGTDPAFAETARKFGTLLAAEDIRLVYGGASVGLMGIVADAVVAGGGKVVGVFPNNLFRRETSHRHLTEMIEVGSLHERKLRMSELADAFVALPGGIGTLEELAEIATWAQLGLHRKPVATLDVNGYWSTFHEFLRTAVRNGLMKPENQGLVVNVESVDDLLPVLRSIAPLTRSQAD
jgi:uncharacterized protein (TIGR00730 family)